MRTIARADRWDHKGGCRIIAAAIRIIDLSPWRSPGRNKASTGCVDAKFEASGLDEGASAGHRH